MPKLLAVDLDGTLIKRDGEVDVRDLEALDRARGLGVIVTIATGRLFAGTRATAAKLGIDFPVACADGAQICHPVDGTEIAHTGIAGEAATALRRALSPRPVCTFLLYRDGVLHDARGASFSKYVKSWSPQLTEVGDLFDHDCWGSERGLSGAVVVGPSDEVSQAAAELGAAGAVDVFDFPVSRAPSGAPLDGVRALLAHAAGVSKGAALATLAKRCGCSREEVAAVGDWHNDVAMFAAVGRSFAMAHAPRRVRAAATDVLVADAHSVGGIAEALDRWLGAT
ncbi:MAG: HAD family phosphatase [Deltaproteobacteria bacterium]|jgi:hydroxymethylpyrimidine pyrophosphatase-like HAD family hydrolase|nr:HAD family phosphatase [Deltaproteobacteria bacterium]MBW2529972.1 HAD family phosphatase [Deltaproteobacteria bacterium]